jgi:hypothetical protein
MREANAVTAVGPSSGDARDVFPVAEAGVPAGMDMGGAMLALRHLNFYRDLLRLGFEGTIWPDRSSRTLRTERLALGIEHPELDLVAVWAARCGDGRVSIPFIEHLLLRARDTAAHFLPLDEMRSIASQLALIDEALLAIAPEGRNGGGPPVRRGWSGGSAGRGVRGPAPGLDRPHRSFLNPRTAGRIQTGQEGSPCRSNDIKKRRCGRGGRAPAAR